jgi:hypothetical protein
MSRSLTEVRAIRADEQAERALTPPLAVCWRRLAKSYWALARQRTEMMDWRELKQFPKSLAPISGQGGALLVERAAHPHGA